MTRYLREENILSAVAYMMGMVSAYLLNISNLSLGSVLTVIAKSMEIVHTNRIEGIGFSYNDFSVLIIGLNSALR